MGAATSATWAAAEDTPPRDVPVPKLSWAALLLALLSAQAAGPSGGARRVHVYLDADTTSAHDDGADDDGADEEEAVPCPPADAASLDESRDAEHSPEAPVLAEEENATDDKAAAAETKTSPVGIRSRRLSRKRTLVRANQH